MLSTYQKIIKISGMLGTSDLNDWETGFVSGLAAQAEQAASTGQIVKVSDKQLEKIEQIYTKHFA